MNVLITQLLAHIDHPGVQPDMDGAELARMLTQLISLEIEEGGPYARMSGGTVRDADVGLNLAIALFLRIHGVRLPKLDAFLNAALSSGDALSSASVDDVTIARLAASYRNDVEAPVAANAAPSSVELNAGEGVIMSALRARAQDRFRAFPPEFAATALAVIERTIHRNPDKQMSLMAYYVKLALGTKGERFGDAFLAELGLANVFFWTAFIIYDDFWDEDESAEPKLLPVANLLARHYTDFFVSLFPDDSAFRNFFNETMDALDAANEWETISCRMRRDGDEVGLPDELPDYGEYDMKFYPSAGHVLGPAAMLVQLGYGSDSSELRGFVSYCKHYLIAMQLNDDMHDWKEDFARGHLSTAVVPLVRAWKTWHPDRHAIHLDGDMNELERLFWFDVLPSLCASVHEHAARSRRALSSISCFENIAPLEQFIVKSERIAQDALLERQRSVDFLTALRS